MISGEPHDNHNWLHKLPYNTVFLDLYGSFPCLTEDERDLLTLRTILAYSIKTRTRLHLKASDFANRIYNKFFHCLGSIKSIYYRFSDPRKIYNNDTFELGYSFDFISNHLANLWLLISDHERITSADRRRFGIQKCKWFTLYAKHETKQIRVGVEPRMRLLWASRLSPEKRLDVLMAIASEASRLLPGVVIEAFGTSTGDLNIREYFPENTSLIYKGAYIDFNELKPEDYDAFIYTTHYDGLPNVVLEAMSWGLPVIAPDVGGLQNAVMDGSTGYLLPDLQDNDEMATAYALAIQRLYQNWNATLDMGQTAQDLIWRRHRPEVYKKRLAQMLL